MPTSGNPELSAGWITDPKGTLERCAKAIRQARGVIKGAADILEIDRRTLWRYIGEHRELATELEAMRKAHHGRAPLWDSAGEKARSGAKKKKRAAASPARNGKATAR
jgi:hypothetical protein